jgi:hypothetical protein
MDATWGGIRQSHEAPVTEGGIQIQQGYIQGSTGTKCAWYTEHTYAEYTSWALLHHPLTLIKIKYT